MKKPAIESRNKMAGTPTAQGSAIYLVNKYAAKVTVRTCKRPACCDGAMSRTTVGDSLTTNLPNPRGRLGLANTDECTHGTIRPAQFGWTV